MRYDTAYKLNVYLLRILLKLLRTIGIVLLSAALLAGASACSKQETTVNEHDHGQGTPVTLGDLDLLIYDSEYVVDNKGEACIAIYIHAVNKGEHARSVMGSYAISRTQASGNTLKVAVAYDTEGNYISTAGSLIQPGETKDVAMCFKLETLGVVNVVFGSSLLGTEETSMTFTVEKPIEEDA